MLLHESFGLKNLYENVPNQQPLHRYKCLIFSRNSAMVYVISSFEPPPRLIPARENTNSSYLVLVLVHSPGQGGRQTL